MALAPTMFVTTTSLPAPISRHPFYVALNKLLAEAQFDEFVEKLCAPVCTALLVLRCTSSHVAQNPRRVTRSAFRSGASPRVDRNGTGLGIDQAEEGDVLAGIPGS